MSLKSEMAEHTATATSNGRSNARRNAGQEEARRVLRHWRDAVPQDRLAHLVRDASRGFGRSLQARLAQFDVPFGHWTFLRILWQRDGLTKRELSLEAGVMEPTTVVALRAMEARGYVRLEQKPDNRKNIYVYLTESGRALESVLVPLAVDVNHIALQGIPRADVETTRRTLLAMIGNLFDDGTPAPERG